MKQFLFVTIFLSLPDCLLLVILYNINRYTLWKTQISLWHFHFVDFIFTALIKCLTKINLGEKGFFALSISGYVLGNHGDKDFKCHLTSTARNQENKMHAYASYCARLQSRAYSHLLSGKVFSYHFRQSSQSHANIPAGQMIYAISPRDSLLSRFFPEIDNPR